MFKRHVLKELSAYLDNQLPEARKSQIEKHIADCAVCGRELSRLKLLSERLKAWQAPNPGEDFDRSVRNVIVSWELKRGELKMKKKTLAILIPSSALAGILLFVLLVGNLYIKRGIVGRMARSADEIGNQFQSETVRHNVPIGAKTYALKAGSGGYANWDGKTSALNFSQGFNLAKRNELPVADTMMGVSESEKYEGRRYAFDGRSREPLESAEFSAAETRPVVNGLPLVESWKAPEVSTEGQVIVIQPVLPATGEGERIIRTAQVALEVEDGNQAYKKAAQVCREFGGYLAASNFYKDAEGREAGTITMRIPQDKFITALERLRDLGKVENINTNSQDVSQDYANLKSRLDAAMVVYTKMLESLQKRQTTIPDAVRLESELTPVLQRIEELKNQIEYLNNAVSFTTISVNFHEPRVSLKILKESKYFIQQSLLATALSAVRFFARAIPVIVLVTLWVAVALVVVMVAKYWIIRLFKRG